MQDLTGTYTYFKEVSDIADGIAEECLSECEGNFSEAKELAIESYLFEVIDNHEWIIYTRYHLKVLEYSSNAEELINEFGKEHVAEILLGKGLSGLHQAMAFWALHIDVLNVLDDAFEDEMIEDRLGLN